MKNKIWVVLGLTVFVAVIALAPELCLADWGGGGELESKVNGFTRGLLTFLLPAVATLGLIYSAILAAIGDAGAKGRITMIVISCVVGLIAPFIIHWLQGLVGG